MVPTRAEQRHLQIQPTTGALAIGRLGYAGGRPVEWRHTLIRGDRFSLLAEFSPRIGYRLTLGGPELSRSPVLAHIAGAAPARLPCGGRAEDAAEHTPADSGLTRMTGAALRCGHAPHNLLNVLAASGPCGLSAGPALNGTAHESTPSELTNNVIVYP